MPKLIAIPGLAVAACLILASQASAQIVVPSNQEFYATPMSHDGMMTMPPMRMVGDTPAKAPMKHHMMKHHMMTHHMKRM